MHIVKLLIIVHYAAAQLVLLVIPSRDALKLYFMNQDSRCNHVNQILVAHTVSVVLLMKIHHALVCKDMQVYLQTVTRNVL